MASQAFQVALVACTHFSTLGWLFLVSALGGQCGGPAPSLLALTNLWNPVFITQNGDMVATACNTPQLAMHGRRWASHRASVNASFCLDGFLGKTEKASN